MRLWLFTRTAGGEFRRLPLARFERFLDGTEYLQDRATEGGFVYVVQVVVAMEDRQARSVQNISCAKHRLTSVGLLDREHWDEGMENAVGQMPSLLPDSGVVGADRFYRRRYELHHSFELSDDDWKNLRAAINRRAKNQIA